MLALTNGTLIDGTGRDLIEKATIVVEGNRISSVNLQEDYPEGATVVDLSNLVIMPGLIDCHLHLGGIVKDEPGQAIGKVSFVDMISYLWDYFRDYAHRRRLAIENGVTSIRSAGDHYPHIVKLREKIKSGKLNGPRVFTLGPIFTAPSGHPASTIYKGNRYIVEHVTRQVEDTNSAREEVKKLSEGGVGWIASRLYMAI